jgi:hypothetical protein
MLVLRDWAKDQELRVAASVAASAATNEKRNFIRESPLLSNAGRDEALDAASDSTMAAVARLADTSGVATIAPREVTARRQSLFQHRYRQNRYFANFRHKPN